MTSSFEFTDNEIRQGIIEVLAKDQKRKWEKQELFEAVNDHLIRKTVGESIERLLAAGLIKKTIDKETGEYAYYPTEKAAKKKKMMKKK